MKNGTGKKKAVSENFTKTPQLYNASQKVYADCMKEKEGDFRGRSVDSRFSYVLAPTLLMFVLWVLTEAVKNGKQRLYFLARDGYMMYQVAEYILQTVENSC